MTTGPAVDARLPDLITRCAESADLATSIDQGTSGQRGCMSIARLAVVDQGSQLDIDVEQIVWISVTQEGGGL